MGKWNIPRPSNRWARPGAPSRWPTSPGRSGPTSIKLDKKHQKTSKPIKMLVLVVKKNANMFSLVVLFLKSFFQNKKDGANQGDHVFLNVYTLEHPKKKHVKPVLILMNTMGFEIVKFEHETSSQVVSLSQSEHGDCQVPNKMAAALHIARNILSHPIASYHNSSQLGLRIGARLMSCFGTWHQPVLHSLCTCGFLWPNVGCA